MTGQPLPADVWAVAPLNPSLAAETRALVARLDSAQRLWLSGYLAGSAVPAAPAAAAVPEPVRPLATILYGTQTGNAERLGKRLGEVLAERGIPYSRLDMMDCCPSHLADAQTLLVIVSTQGEGDPPDRAIAFLELLKSRKAPRLAHVQYSVLALGDSSYENFCETGKQFDAQLATLGATPLQPRVDCDVDFEVPAGAWIDAIVDRLATLRSAITPPRSVAFAEHRSASISNAYTRKNPFNAPVLLNQRLTARGSTKDVRHIELSLTGSNMHYEPGDAIGIVPHNDAAQVDALLQALPFAANAPVVVESREVSLHDSLRDRYDIGLLSQAFLERYASAVTDTGLPKLLKKQSPEVLQRLIAERTLIDLVREHPPLGLDAGAFARLLRPLAPRLYSIASSMRTAPDEVHLTVSVVEYASSSGSRRGVVSGFLADLASDAATAPIYLHRNPGFRLPDSDRPIIMIGPGTGVAPFRAFVAERAAVNARGRNWLFFGDRSFETDFLYQSEWLDWRKRGVLTRFDVAFSRDQREKSYVQHRMREHGAQLWAWLEEGAHLYVCGDAQRMAVDVHDTLLEITKQHGGRSDEGAGEYLLQLQREHRYQRDVY